MLRRRIAHNRGTSPAPKRILLVGGTPDGRRKTLGDKFIWTSEKHHLIAFILKLPP